MVGKNQSKTTTQAEDGFVAKMAHTSIRRHMHEHIFGYAKHVGQERVHEIRYKQMRQRRRQRVGVCSKTIERLVTDPPSHQLPHPWMQQ